ncbi:hypothetical protein MTO96_021801 [Rhipicephalus appendiculatus]
MAALPAFAVELFAQVVACKHCGSGLSHRRVPPSCPPSGGHVALRGKKYDEVLSELGLTQFVAGPRSDSLRSDGAFAGGARVPPMVPPLPPPQPVSRRRLASQASMDNAGEPTSKRFNSVSESEDDRICEQDAALVGHDEESGKQHLDLVLSKQAQLIGFDRAIQDALHDAAFEKEMTTT